MLYEVITGQNNDLGDFMLAIRGISRRVAVTLLVAAGPTGIALAQVRAIVIDPDDIGGVVRNNFV